MECDDFGAEEILAGGDAGWHGEVDPALVADHAVDAPVSGAVEAVFEDLEPFLARGGGAGGVVDFGPAEGLVSWH